MHAQTVNFSLLFLILDTFTLYHNKHFPHNLFVQKFGCSVAESWFLNYSFLSKLYFSKAKNSFNSIINYWLLKYYYT